MELASIHNLHFYLDLVREARKMILEGNFKKWKIEKIMQISFNINNNLEE
jgi:queuine tRNA-ribosyltransferase